MSETGDDELPLPGIARWGLGHATHRLPPGVVAAAVRRGAKMMARRFLGGADAAEALATLSALHEEGLRVSVDRLGEAVIGEAEADAYLKAALDTIDRLATHAREQGWQSGAEGPSTGPLNLSLKASSLYSRCTPRDPRGSIAGVLGRLRPLLHAARERGLSVCLDMEHYDLKHITLGALREVMLEQGLRDWDGAGIASHNLRSLALAMAHAETHGIAPQGFEFQMLYGMGEALRGAVALAGYPVRVYLPFGEPLPGMAYLVRRLLENSSSQSFLSMGSLPAGESEVLLAPPGKGGDRRAPAASGGFANEPVHRYTESRERDAFQGALTGGVYSRSPASLDRARRDFRVGNLYLNRGITGALVGRQPFGGFGMSGVGSKAGGPDYLLQFTEPRTVTENTLRRGYAPNRHVAREL